jgi:hypothetical protein
MRIELGCKISNHVYLFEAQVAGITIGSVIGVLLIFGAIGFIFKDKLGKILS